MTNGLMAVLCLLCVILGMFAALAMVTSSMDGKLGECRAANPGFDCRLGWVVGEAFK